MLSMFTSCNNEPNSSVLSKYTVTFDALGGASTIKTEVNEGSTVTKPEDPTREHYSFDGWYLNGEKFDFSIPIKSDITLVAKWSFSSHIFVDNVCTICSGEKCGDNAVYFFDDATGILTITGVGETYNYDPYYNSSPWDDKYLLIKQVTICEGITRIGWYAFSYCYNLNHVEFPSTLKIIGSNSFATTGLKNIVISIGITEIEYGAFDNCNGLNIQYEGTKADWDNKGLAMTGDVDVIFSDGSKLIYRLHPSKTELIGLTPYGRTLNKIDIPIPNTVNRIQNRAFKESNLEEIEIPGTVETIGDYAFQNCKSLKKVVINKGVKKLGIYIFDGCNSLNELFLPSTLTECYNIIPEPKSGITIHYEGTKTDWDTLTNKATQSGLKFIKENLTVICTDKSVTYDAAGIETVTDLVH